MRRENRGCSSGTTTLEQPCAGTWLLNRALRPEGCTRGTQLLDDHGQFKFFLHSRGKTFLQISMNNSKSHSRNREKGEGRCVEQIHPCTTKIRHLKLTLLNLSQQLKAQREPLQQPHCNKAGLNRLYSLISLPQFHSTEFKKEANQELYK